MPCSPPPPKRSKTKKEPAEVKKEEVPAEIVQEVEAPRRTAQPPPPTRTTAKAPPSAPASPAAVARASQPHIPVPDEYVRITLGTAKSTYKLTDRDLAGVDCQLKTNPHHRKFAPMRLYSALECYNLAMKKFGGAAGLLEALEKSRARGEKMKATRAENAKNKKEAARREKFVARQLDIYSLPHEHLSSNDALEAYIATGDGDVATIIAQLVAEAAVAQQGGDGCGEGLDERYDRLIATVLKLDY